MHKVLRIEGSADLDRRQFLRHIRLGSTTESNCWKFRYMQLSKSNVLKLNIETE